MVNREYNYGLAFLRMLMCFEVVLCHFWTPSTSVFLMPFGLLRECAVPVFMFLSFFLMEKNLLQKNSIGKRFVRLLSPLIGWALIYWVVYFIVQRTNFADLLWQIFTGHSPKLNPTMWFQSVLLALTIIWMLIFRFFEKSTGIFILWALLLCAFVVIHSEINYKLFNPLRYELKYPLGRLCEMIPYATCGFFCAYYSVFDKMKACRQKSIIILCLSFIFLLKYKIINTAAGFGYSDHNCILFAFVAVGIAYLLPFDKFSKRILDYIKYATRFSLGIYCMHRMIGDFLFAFLRKIEIEMDAFLLCIVIYIICFIASSLIFKIPIKFFRQIVD